MGYTRYQVILVAEDGEYVLSEWQTEQRAIDEAVKLEANYGEGQRLEVRDFTGGY